VKHGYTNATVRSGRGVTKTYAGPDARERKATEEHALRTLAGRIPVPRVLWSKPGSLTTSYVEGQHGQDLLDIAPREVLRGCGEVLARLHAIPVGDVFPRGQGVVVHGDFGPNNVLLDGSEVVALLDWEWARPGAAITDLAWCEWVVRTHHPAQQPALDAFYAAYGERPSLDALRTAGLERCAELLDFVEHWQPGGPAVRLWQDRIAAVERWQA
jgi:aminoglycoside phosphotransferase (APT) family kinase protein